LKAAVRGRHPHRKCFWTFRIEKPANPRALAVQLEDGRTVTAQVFIYGGRNLIAGSMPLADKAAMVAKAGGIRGSNFDYVRDTYEGLKGVGVDDPAVTTLWEAVKKYPGQPKPL